VEKMKNTKEAEQLKQSVIDYTKKNITDPSFSNILGIKLLQDNGKTAEANELIQKISESGRPDNPVSKWVIAMSNKDEAAAKDLEKRFDDNISFNITKRLIDLAK
jgi:hypothetical protein